MFPNRSVEEMYERELRPIVQKEVMSMPTTILDRESLEDARRRRFQEEAAIDARIAAQGKHTPGPWRVGGKELRVIFAANGDVVARTAAYGEQSETPEAESGNAALIAAAPSLLNALQAVANALEWHEDRMPKGQESGALDLARAAMAMAKQA